jgi:hypothetical protein
MRPADRPRHQQLALTQAAAESGNSVITSTVVAAPMTKAKPKTISAESLFMAVTPSVMFVILQRRGQNAVTEITGLPEWFSAGQASQPDSHLPAREGEVFEYGLREGAGAKLWRTGAIASPGKTPRQGCGGRRPDRHCDHAAHGSDAGRRRLLAAVRLGLRC